LAAVLGLFGSLSAGDASGLDATLRFFEETSKGVDGLEPSGPSTTLESASTTIACVGEQSTTKCCSEIHLSGFGRVCRYFRFGQATVILPLSQFHC
jgi:hypothetical protein